MKLNLKYKPLIEASVGGGAVGGFVGRAGTDVDDVFMGSFFPNDNLIIDLEQQMIDNNEHRLFSDEKTPEQEKKWDKLETNLKYDKIVKELDTEKYKNDTNKMKNIDLGDIYDIEDEKDMSAFKNETNEWKPIVSLTNIYKEL